jgi:hypothetical protein
VQQRRNGRETNAGRQEGLHRCFGPVVRSAFLRSAEFLQISSSDYLLQIIWQGEQRVIDRKGSAGKVGFGRGEAQFVDFCLKCF